jgi:hypothetical protein
MTKKSHVKDYPNNDQLTCRSLEVCLLYRLWLDGIRFQEALA